MSKIQILIINDSRSMRLFLENVIKSFSDCETPKKVVRLGIPDVFAKQYGSQDIIMEGFGLAPDNIVKTVIRHLRYNT